MSEATLQAQCFTWHWNNYPDERGFLYMQYNNPKNAAHGSVLKAMGLVKGVSDLAYIPELDKMTYIEIKLPGEKQSKAQKDWQKKVEARGCKYIVIDNFKSFKKLFL